ncbi:MAG: flagellar hook-basal body complex protein, partial [Rhodospirillales bacterium]
MSLFGALTSGVSGLTAQSSAMGAISDNITNVSTIGYKNTRVDFQTLVTAQTSATLYSAGGVQSSPRQDTGVQGLLKSTDSQTDLSMSGSGFFVVNGASQPSVANEFLFTRSGSFFQDADGFLRNNAGFYLQAWPTDALGEVIPSNESLSVPNQNVISTDYLESVNLNRVGGTATATSQLSIGANLPSNDAAGTTHRTDVQFFDTLGNANSMSIQYIKSTVDNQWDVALEPPSGTATVKLETTATSGEKVYKAVGQLQFTARPAEGSKVIVDGISYVVDDANDGGAITETATTKRWVTTGNLTIAQDIA